MSAEPIRLTRAQVRDVDRRAIEGYGLPGIVLMENAALHAADVARAMLNETEGKMVTIYCGPGNNGGDGLAIARHLHNRGAAVSVVLAFDPARQPSPDCATHLAVARKIGLPTHWIDDRPPATSADLVIDAVLGTGATSPARGQAKTAIDAINARNPTPVLAIDLPSGLGCDTGEPLGPCVRATRTVTFVAEKLGFANPAAGAYTGEVVVADIGCPREIIDAVRRAPF